MNIIKYSVSLAAMLAATQSFANLSVPIYLTNDQGQGKMIGHITIENVDGGIELKPDLTDLPPGLHGFHVHAHASCEHHGQDAGSHLDPKKTGKHLGPYNNNGHLGDLPALYADNKGDVTLPIFAPRLTEDQLKNHALMIHEGGDNYSDNPALGGGGKRIACGIVK